MKILIAPDKFKGSLTALEAATAIRDGLLEVFPHADFDLCPLADGGEGTLDTLIAGRGGRIETADVPGPLGRTVKARWGLLPDGTAVIEAAEALSLARIAPDPLDPARASSAGLGALIRMAAAGSRRLLIGLGGTGTMDGGSGMLTALGARLLDAGGHPLPPGGEPLQGLETIDATGLADWRALEIVVLCDVTSPLLGPDGAAHVFGPQKGADPAMVESLERALTRWREVWARAEAGAGAGAGGGAGALEQVPGDGAAGGLGFGLRVGLGARLEPGGPFLMRALGLPGRLSGVDLVITGEGSIDEQSLKGKLVGVLAGEAARVGVPLVAIGGQVRPLAGGGDYPFPALSLSRHPRELREAISSTRTDLRQAASRLGRLLRIGAGIFH